MKVNEVALQIFKSILEPEDYGNVEMEVMREAIEWSFDIAEMFIEENNKRNA
jgi:hypothetical protein